MILFMIERSWGISRKDGKYRSHITGIRARHCKVGKLPQICSRSYEFEITRVGKGEIVISHFVRRKNRNEDILVKRFVPNGYYPMSFDGGYKYHFFLI